MDARVPPVTPKYAWYETAALFGIAFALRAWSPGASFFGVDQVGTLLNARAALDGDWFRPGPEIGWSGLVLGPLFNQVAAIAMWPRGAFGDVIVTIALLHALAILGWRRVFRTVGDPNAARLAAFALAVHPILLSSGSAPISSSLVLPTTLVLVWGLVTWIHGKSGVGFGVACVGAALAIQAHITTVLLLPIFLLGFRRRAPIGRAGLVGLGLAALVAAPNLVHNLPAILSDRWGGRHAGASGAGLPIAALRALLLEARMADVCASTPSILRWPLTIAGGAWTLVATVGAASLVRRKAPEPTRWLLLGGLAVPTIAIVCIPRGALYYYLDQTVPWRCWLFATGVLALLSHQTVSASRVLRWAVVPAILASVALLGSTVPAARAFAHAQGYWRVNMAHVDLREPLGIPETPVGILTLESQQALGRTLAAAGADPASLGLHGPWQWVMSFSTGPWVGEASSTRRAPVASGGSFLVLHRDDRCPVPATPARAAGAFRVHRFDDRAIQPSANATEHVELGVRADVNGAPATVAIVGFATHVPVRRAAPDPSSSMRPCRSASGFVVWSTTVEPPPQRPLVFDFRPDAVRNPLVRPVLDAYAFTGAPERVAPRLR